MKKYNIMKAIVCAFFGALTLFSLSENSLGEDPLAQRYAQIRRTTAVALPGQVIEPTASNVWEVWNLADPDVSAKTVELLNLVARDFAAYPLSIDAVIDELVYANPKAGWMWIIDHFALFAPLGRARICNALGLHASVESADLIHAHIRDKRSQGLPRVPALGDPQFAPRVCDDATTSLIQIADSCKMPIDIGDGIGPESDYTARDEVITVVSNWWNTNQDVLKAKLPRVLKTSPAAQQKLTTLIQQLSAE